MLIRILIAVALAIAVYMGIDLVGRELATIEINFVAIFGSWLLFWRGAISVIAGIVYAVKGWPRAIA